MVSQNMQCLPVAHHPRRVATGTVGVAPNGSEAAYSVL